jgi:DNA-directed RNA polymerase specialized sigma24 family protein
LDEWEPAVRLRDVGRGAGRRVRAARRHRRGARHRRAPADGGRSAARPGTARRDRGDRRGKYPTFPSRRHHEQLAALDIDPAAVALLTGLPYDEAREAADKLGLRLSTGYMLLHRAPRQLDVLADDGEVTNILGLHV